MYIGGYEAVLSSSFVLNVIHGIFVLLSNCFVFRWEFKNIKRLRCHCYSHFPSIPSWVLEEKNDIIMSRMIGLTYHLTWHRYSLAIRQYSLTFSLNSDMLLAILPTEQIPMEIIASYHYSFQVH